MNDLAAILLIRDRTRELELLERCLRLEQENNHLRTTGRRRPVLDAATAQVDAEVLRLRNVEQLTFRQIGARLGMPETTAQYRYRRACGPRQE